MESEDSILLKSAIVLHESQDFPSIACSNTFVLYFAVDDHKSYCARVKIWRKGMRATFVEIQEGFDLRLERSVHMKGFRF